MQITKGLKRLSCLLSTFVFMIGFGVFSSDRALCLDGKRPNILFAIADDWSFGHASAYGCRWTDTPNFDEIARRGLLFTHAYTPNAKCAPSRACILTGRNSWQLDEACNHVCEFPHYFKSFPEALAENGYRVGMTGKGWGPGNARDAKGKPRQIAGQPFAKIKHKPPAKGISNNDYSGNFKSFLAGNQATQPWCFWYGTTEPHRGYQWQVGINNAGKKLSDIDVVPSFWPDNEITRTDMLDYAYEVEHFDRHLGIILDAIKKAGQMENTIVVVTSDHGMPFPRCKGQAYDYSNHVPLAISWPHGIRKGGRRIEDYVSFVDIAPTLIEVAGISWRASGMQDSPGKSLSDIFRSEKSGQVNIERDHVLIGKERHDIGRPDDAGYPIRGIVKNNKLYIKNYTIDRWPAGNPEAGYLNCDGGPTKTNILNRRRESGQDTFWDLCFGKRPEEEFYDLAADPFCTINLAVNATYRSDMDALYNQMSSELLGQKDRRILGDVNYFENIPYVNAAQRNFYNRLQRGEKVKAGWVNPTDFEKQKLD